MVVGRRDNKTHYKFNMDISDWFIQYGSPQRWFLSFASREFTNAEKVESLYWNLKNFIVTFLKRAKMNARNLICAFITLFYAQEKQTINFQLVINYQK